jgi:hypothetical protein
MLADAIKDETDRAQGEESMLADAIKSETERAQGEEGKLDDAIKAETERATGEEGKLADAIKAETARAEGEESVLSNSIGAVANRVNTITEDTLDGNNMSLSGFAKLNTVEAAELAVTQAFRIPQVRSQSELDDVLSKYPEANGMMFYLDMDDNEATTAGFEDGYKLYFCEGNEWHPSPFHSEGGEAGNPDPSGSSWKDILSKATGELGSFDPLA